MAGDAWFKADSVYPSFDDIVLFCSMNPRENSFILGKRSRSLINSHYGEKFFKMWTITALTVMSQMSKRG